MTMINLNKISDLFLYSRGSFHEDSAIARLWSSTAFKSWPLVTQPESVYYTPVLCVCMHVWVCMCVCVLEP